MNEKSIQQILLKQLYPQRAKIMDTNFWLGYGECDLIAVNPSDYVVEYEIKCSRSDFKADRKKVNKHKRYMGAHTYGKTSMYGIPNRFYYVCPSGLLKPNDMFNYSGLIYVDESGNLETIVKAPLIHNQKCGPKLLEKLAHSLTIKLVYKGIGQSVQSIGSQMTDYPLSSFDLPNGQTVKFTPNPAFDLPNEAKEFFKNIK